MAVKLTIWDDNGKQLGSLEHVSSIRITERITGEHRLEFSVPLLTDDVSLAALGKLTRVHDLDRPVYTTKVLNGAYSANQIEVEDATNFNVGDFILIFDSDPPSRSFVARIVSTTSPVFTLSRKDFDPQRGAYVQTVNFRTYRITDYSDNRAEHIREVQAEYISYDLNFHKVVLALSEQYSFSAEGSPRELPLPLSEMLGKLLQGTGWVAGDVYSTSELIPLELSDATVREALELLKEAWTTSVRKMLLRFREDKAVDFVRDATTDTGVQFRYAANLVSMMRSFEKTDIANAVIGFGAESGWKNVSSKVFLMQEEIETEPDVLTLLRSNASNLKPGDMIRVYHQPEEFTIGGFDTSYTDYRRAISIPDSQKPSSTLFADATAGSTVIQLTSGGSYWCKVGKSALITDGTNSETVVISDVDTSTDKVYLEHPLAHSYAAGSTFRRAFATDEFRGDQLWVSEGAGKYQSRIVTGNDNETVFIDYPIWEDLYSSCKVQIAEASFAEVLGVNVQQAYVDETYGYPNIRKFKPSLELTFSDHDYAEGAILFTSGSNRGKVYQVKDCLTLDPDTNDRTIELKEVTDPPLTSGSEFLIFERIHRIYDGIVSNAYHADLQSVVVFQGTPEFADDVFINGKLYILSGSGKGQVAGIADNTSNSVTTSAQLTTLPQAGDRALIWYAVGTGTVTVKLANNLKYPAKTDDVIELVLRGPRLTIGKHKDYRTQVAWFGSDPLEEDKIIVADATNIEAGDRVFIGASSDVLKRGDMVQGQMRQVSSVSGTTVTLTESLDIYPAPLDHVEVLTEVDATSISNYSRREVSEIDPDEKDPEYLRYEILKTLYSRRQPEVSYSVQVGLYEKEASVSVNKDKLVVGDYARVIDPELGINELYQIIEKSYNPSFPETVELELAEDPRRFSELIVDLEQKVKAHERMLRRGSFRICLFWDEDRKVCVNPTYPNVFCNSDESGRDGRSTREGKPISRLECKAYSPVSSAGHTSSPVRFQVGEWFSSSITGDDTWHDVKTIDAAEGVDFIAHRVHLVLTEVQEVSATPYAADYSLADVRVKPADSLHDNGYGYYPARDNGTGFIIQAKVATGYTYKVFVSWWAYGYKV